MVKIKKKYLYYSGVLVALFLIVAFFLLKTPNYENIVSERPYIGNANAEIIIEEFSDIECPACQKAYWSIKAIAEEYKDDVKLEFHHYPLSFHKNAMDAALASECANDQGKFWEYVEELYTNQKDLSTSLLYETEKKLGLEHTKFKACLKSKAKADIIYEDIAKGRMRGLKGTPTIYINEKEMENWSIEVLREEIEMLLGN